MKTKRFRHSWTLIEGIGHIRPYEFEKVESKETLFKVMKIKINHIDYAH